MRLFLLVAAAAWGIPAAAPAHPTLVSSTPAADATIAKPARIELRFSEKLVPQFTGAELMMTGMAGMSHAPAKVAVATSIGKDGATLIVHPRAALAAGTYSVAWHVVSSDTHRVDGTLAFTVK